MFRMSSRLLWGCEDGDGQIQNLRNTVRCLRAISLSSIVIYILFYDMLKQYLVDNVDKMHGVHLAVVCCIPLFAAVISGLTLELILFRNKIWIAPSSGKAFQSGDATSIQCSSVLQGYGFVIELSDITSVRKVEDSRRRIAYIVIRTRVTTTTYILVSSQVLLSEAWNVLSTLPCRSASAMHKVIVTRTPLVLYLVVFTVSFAMLCGYVSLFY